MGDNAQDFVGAMLSPRPASASLSRDLVEHRQQLESLEDDGQNPRALVSAQGGVSTEKTSSLSIGIAKLTISQRDESYRNPDALKWGTDEIEAEGAKWRPLRAATTLKSQQAAHGDNLMAFDTTRVDVIVEFFSVEIYSARTKSARALIRG